MGVDRPVGRTDLTFTAEDISLASGARLLVPTADAWTAETVYDLGDLVDDGDGGIWECITAGTSGAMAPEWVYADGVTLVTTQTTDNDITWDFLGSPSLFPLNASSPLGGLVGWAQFVPRELVANVPLVDPELTDADTAVNAVITNMIGAGIMTPGD